MGPVHGSGRSWGPVLVGPSALLTPGTRSDDVTVPSEWLALAGWAVLFAMLVLAAILIGRLAARFFLRATGARADRR